MEAKNPYCSRDKLKNMPQTAENKYRTRPLVTEFVGQCIIFVDVIHKAVSADSLQGTTNYGHQTWDVIVIQIMGHSVNFCVRTKVCRTTYGPVPVSQVSKVLPVHAEMNGKIIHSAL